MRLACFGTGGGGSAGEGVARVFASPRVLGRDREGGTPIRRVALIDQVDRRLKSWVGKTVEGAEVSLAPPGKAPPEPSVGLYLMEVLNSPVAPNARTLPPHQITLRYLVTTWAEAEEESHRLLGTLVFEALRDPDLQVELEPVPVTVWSAFGVEPRPSFVLRVPLRYEEPRPKMPLVKQHMRIETTPMKSLHGIIVGPGDVPIMGASVQLPHLNLNTKTDSHGRLRFAAVPAEPRIKLFRVRAKGLTQEERMSDKEPVTIRIKGLED